MIQIQDVSFEYEKEQGTLSHIDLNIQQGECVVLTGESGCGKTTVTKLINGLIPHFVEGGTLSGTTIVNGMEVPKTEMYRLAEQVGSVFQNPKSQFFNIDSDSEITFGLENAGVEPKKIKERYEATVSALKIQSLLGRNIFSMSGGEKQSLAFASVYAMNPSVFVLDEPTANLDADAIDTLRQQIIQIKKEGRTVVIAEHRLYFLMDLIDRAIFIQKGKIVQIFSGNEFRNLSDEQRIRMGLRSLVHPVLELPPADPSGAQEDTANDENDMTTYYNKDDGVSEKLTSAVWSVELHGGRLFGRIDCSLKEALTAEETEALRDWLTGQCSDGLGEGFEQQPIDTMDGELFVSFGNSGDDYAMMTESEFDDYRQQNEMQMGGM